MSKKSASEPGSPGKKILWGSIAVLGIFSIPMVLFFLPIWDGPPVDDSDMEIVYRQIPDEENAFELFREAADSMQGLPINDVYASWMQEPDVHEVEIQEFARANRKSMELLREGISKGDYRTKNLKRFSDTAPWISENLNLGKMLQVMVLSSETPEERVELTLTHLRFAELCHQAGVSLVEAVVGYMLYSQFSESMLAILHEKAISFDTLEFLSERLKQASVETERLVTAIKGAYRALKLGMEVGMTGLEMEELDGAFKNPGSWSYQPENTKRLFLEDYRTAIAILQNDSFNLMPDNKHFRKIGVDEGPFSFVGRSFNETGKILYEMLMFGMPHTFDRLKATQMDLTAVQVITAIHLYQREHGRMPGELEELVPRYLDEVPRDAFDGEPLRYLPDTARVYSVGKDRRDDGGSTEVEGSRMGRRYAKDLVYGIFEKIDFEREDGRP